MKEKLLLFFLLTTLVYAENYTLYLTSTNSLQSAKEHYENIKFHIPDSFETIIHQRDDKSYTLLIRDIETLEKAKRIQKLLYLTNNYQNSYIKVFDKKPNYNVIQVKNEKIKNEEPYKQNLEQSNKYITAVTMYNTEQFVKSYELFNKLFLENNYNLNVNYFLAKSAFKIKKYDEAMAAYERVLIINPDFNQARYDYARILYKLKQKKEAKIEFNKLLSSNINPEIKTQITEYLKILNNKMRGSANIIVGLSRSTNINNGLLSPEYRLPGLNDILVKGEDPISDSAHSEMLDLNFYNYFKDDTFRLKNSFLVYNKNYFNETDENITLLSYKPTLSYLDKDYLYALGFGIERIIKSREDFNSYFISPQITNKDFFINLKYQKVQYISDVNKEKDFHKIQLFGKINLFKNMNYYTNLYKNIRDKNIRTDIDKYTIGNGLNLFYNINKNNKINLKYQLNYSKYKYENNFFESKREDKQHLVELSLSHALNKDNFINISTSYLKNNSNQDAYVYDEKAIKLNYLKAIQW
jgi:tetratricopeptide (TPR) repeat protein